MSKKDIAYLLMILNVSRCAHVILERSLRANESQIGVNESISIIIQMNGCFLEMNSKRCNGSGIFVEVDFVVFSQFNFRSETFCFKLID